MSNFLSRHFGLPMVVFMIALSPVACDSVKPTPAREQEITLYDFTSAMRWSDFDKAYDFVDPKTKIAHPLSDVDRSRYKQVEVSGYDVIAHTEGAGTIDQQIQLGLINRNTQVPRTVVYHEHWRWDAVLRKWWLTTGLPDITAQ